MTKIPAWLFCSCIVASTAVAEELSNQAIPEKEKFIYASLEAQIKRQYEATVASGMAHLQQTGKLNTLPKQELVILWDALKNTFYNKAAMQVICVGDALRSLPSYDPTSKTFQDNVKNCFEAKMIDFQVSEKLVDADYLRVLPPGTGKRCEMEARLFERELQLPPYEFLKTKDNMLFDFEKYNQCLRSTH